jgi:hypothetical protein
MRLKEPRLGGAEGLLLVETGVSLAAAGTEGMWNRGAVSKLCGKSEGLSTGGISSAL